MRRILNHTHRYWLRETQKKRMQGLMVGDYSGTDHEHAIDGLINMGYVKVKKVLPGGVRIIEITSSGVAALK